MRGGEGSLAELSSRMDAGESTRGGNQMVLVRFGRVEMGKASEPRERVVFRHSRIDIRYVRRIDSSLTKEVGRNASDRCNPSWPLQPLANFVGPLDGINHSHRGQVHQYDALCTPVTNLTRARRSSGISLPEGVLSRVCVCIACTYTDIDRSQRIAANRRIKRSTVVPLGS